MTKENPKEGGRYTRTKSTGKLRRVEEPTAERSSEPETEAASAATETSDAETNAAQTNEEA